MSTTVTVSGDIRYVPATGERSWGPNTSALLISLANISGKLYGGLSSNLSAGDHTFTGSKGLVSLYYKSNSSDISTAGTLRLSSTDNVGWRNNANDGDLSLGIGDDDLVEFNSVDLVDVSTAQTLTNKTLTSPIVTSPVLTTPQINDTSADHQYVFVVNELTADRNVTLPLLTGDDTFVFNSHAATLTNKSIDSDNNTITNIVNADIKAAAAIEVSKLAALTASKAVASDGSGFLTASATTATELGYVSGVTSAIQTQINTKAPSDSPVLTTPQINDTSSDHQYVFVVSELTSDRNVTLPLLTGDDTFVFQAHSQTLTNKTIDSDNNTITNIVNADIKANAAIDTSKLAAATQIGRLALGGTLTTLAAWTQTGGAHTVDIITSANTEITLPTTGTLATLAGTETLTNKKLNGGTASTSNEWLLPSNTTGNEGGLSTTESNFYYNSTAKKLKVYDGSGWKVVGGGLITTPVDHTYASTLEAGKHYLVDMSGAAASPGGDITLNLPAGAAESVIRVTVVGNSTNEAKVTFDADGAEEFYYDGSTDTTVQLINVESWVQFMWDSNDSQWVVDDASTPVLADFSGDLAVSGKFRIATSTPASAAATGTAGTIAWDADYIYICTATDTWKRVAIATWP